MNPIRLVQDDAAGPLPAPAADVRDSLASLVEALADAVVIVGADGRISVANAAFRTGFCTAEGPVAGALLADVVAPDVVAAFAEAGGGVSAAAPRAAFETRTADPAGRPRWTRWTVQGVHDAAGIASGFQASGQDVTEQRAYQTALERMITIVNEPDTPVGTAILDLLEIGLEFFGLDAAVLGHYLGGRLEVTHAVGRPDLRSPECTAPCADVFAEATRSSTGPVAVPDVAASRFRDRACRRQTPVACFIGQRLDVGDALHAVVLFYGARPRVPSFRPDELTLARLLTQSIAFAIERQEQVDALSASRSELAMILESVPAYIAYRDHEGRLLSANAAARRVAWSDETRAADAAALGGGEPVLGSVERWEDEETGARWVRADRIPFTTARSTPARLLVVAADVTELVENRQQLADANAGLNQFTYIASHDLQEPLRKIGTFTDVLLDGLGSGNREDVDYAVRVIKDSARRASKLIQDLLTWSRLTNRALEKVPVALSAFARDTLRDVLSARPDVAVEVDDRMQDVTVRADPGQVRQLVENLATNAVKYRSPDRPARIVLRCAPTGRGTILFAIEDNGIGFDPVYRDIIFEPFRRLHADRDYPGSGIGLAICAKVCERHGWAIRALGRPGEGATFEVEIPLKPGA